MKVTKKSEYAVRAILYLSTQKPNVKVMAKEISKNMAVPQQFLAQVMLSLNHHGYVKAVRGAKGGFMLAKKPSQINLLEIIEAIEGKFSLNECLTPFNSCQSKSICPIADVWGEAQGVLMGVLKKATFSSMAKRIKEKSKFSLPIKEDDVCCKSLAVGK